ncbi:MAG: hypothetical protein AAGF66_15885 [Cyanobacteria bacterium P01_H01_bin.119]
MSLSTPSASSLSDQSSDAAQPSSVDDKICWIEVDHYPYKADHQVELLHLQAEADALLVELQALNQRRINTEQRLDRPEPG